MVKSILDLFDKMEPIKIVDIGAMLLNEESYSYYNLMKNNLAEVIGFEPNNEECNKLTEYAKTSNMPRKYLPYAIGDGKTKLFHITNSGMTSSLYQPDLELMSKFNNIANLCKVEKVELVKTKRLDDIVELKDTDYLKIDIQGAEKEVFENAEETLKNVLVVHTEVEFVKLYKGQPLFADVDAVLRKNGFQFHKFDPMQGRCFKPLVREKNINSFIGQVLWTDAIYVKDFMNLDIIDNDKLLKLAIILHELYGSYDFSHYVLEVYDRKTGSNYSEKYKKDILEIQI